MKALVLSGGLGTRLRPLTHSMPKQLVPVANRPVIYHGLENIRRAGITQVGMVVGDRGAVIAEELGDGSALGIAITYIHQERPLGLAHCVAISRDFLGDEDFIMYLGDNVLGGDVIDFVADFQERRPAAEIVVTKVPDPCECGVAEVDADGRVLGLEEKPRRPRSELGLMGVYLFTPVIHRAVQSIRPSLRNEWEITDAIQHLVAEGADVRAYVYSGYWKDTGKIEDLLECNRALLDLTRATSLDGVVDEHTEIIGPVVVESGARITRSRIIGPAVIGEKCVVEDSVVGPYTSIGACCVVEAAGIEDSIVMTGATVRGVRGMQGSLIGRSARVARSSGLFGTRRLMIGDDSTVEIG